jgi:hypothetical protein
MIVARSEMETNRKIVIDVPDDVFESITEFKKRMRIDNDSTAVFELLKYALSLPPYFAFFDWRIAEEEADADIESGNVRSFESTDDFLADLRI